MTKGQTEVKPIDPDGACARQRIRPPRDMDSNGADQ